MYKKLIVLFSLALLIMLIPGYNISALEQIHKPRLLPNLQKLSNTPIETSSNNTTSVRFPNPKLSDVRVRQAIAYCTDRHALAQAAYPQLSTQEIDALMTDSFLPTNHWAYSKPTTQYPFDPVQGGILLDQAGWTFPQGGTYRTNAAGDVLVLKLFTTWVDFRIAWAGEFEQQMLDCGIWVLPLFVPPSWIFGEDTGISRRDFDLGGFAWIIEQDPPVDQIYGCDYIPSSQNDWQGLNVVGWCNETASDAAKIAADTLLTQQERLPHFAILQEEFASDMPSLPIFERTEGGVVESINLNFASPAPPNPALKALKVRQSIAYCTDRHALAQASYPQLSTQEIDALMMDSFLPKNHWAYSKPTTQYPFDPVQGGILLDQAGWTFPQGGTYRTNAAGDVLVLKLFTTGADLRIAWAGEFEQQMLDCGIWVLPFFVSPSWLFGEDTGISRRDFDLGGFAWGIDQDPPVDQLYGCDYIPSPQNDWQGLNVAGWCNETASDAAKIAADTLLTQQERLPYFAILQEEFASDMPSLPIFERIEGTFWEQISFNMFTFPGTVYIPIVLR